MMTILMTMDSNERDGDANEDDDDDGGVTDDDDNDDDDDDDVDANGVSILTRPPPLLLTSLRFL